jgi:hypothetical protein
VRSEATQPELPPVAPIRLFPWEVNVFPGRSHTSGSLGVAVLPATMVLPIVTVLRKPAYLEHARRAVALDPKDGDFRTTLALAEFRAGHWAESIALTKGVDGSNGFFLAMALWQNGEKEEARRCFDKAAAWAREKDPNNVDLAQFWAEAAKLLGRPGPAAKSGTAPADARPQPLR